MVVTIGGGALASACSEDRDINLLVKPVTKQKGDDEYGDPSTRAELYGMIGSTRQRKVTFREGIGAEEGEAKTSAQRKCGEHKKTGVR